MVTDKDTDAAGEQIPTKPTMDSKRFDNALKAIQEGKITKEKLIAKFDLTNVQSKALELC